MQQLAQTLRHSHVKQAWNSMSTFVSSPCSPCAGVFCPGGSGDDGGEPPRCAAADSAVHHEQVSLRGDVQGTTLSPVHCRDNGKLPPFDVQQKGEYFKKKNFLKQVCLFLLVQGEYVSCLLSLLQQMTEIHFHHLLNNFHSKEELKVRKS